MSDKSPDARFPTVELMGLRIHALTEAQVIAHILDESDRGRGGWVITPNLDHLRRVVYDRSLLRLYARADLVVADGMVLVWASRLAGTPLPQRVAGSDLIHSLTAAACRRNKSVYFLGGDPGTAAEAARILAERNAGLRIAGHCCPAYGFESRPAEVDEVMRSLAAADADIVYVALGSPKQERFIARVRDRLPRAWWLGVGISFSFVCGKVSRAPRWMQQAGLEWLHRLSQEPGRLARRYLIDGLPFAAYLMLWAAWRRWRAADNPAVRSSRT